MANALTRDTLGTFLRRGFRLAGIMLFIQLLIVFIIPTLPFLPGEQQFYVSTVKRLGDNLRGLPPSGLVPRIFANNLRVAGAELIPVIGLIVFGMSSYGTSRAIEAIALLANNSGLRETILVFSVPHSLLELSAYAITTVEGIFLLNSIRYKEGRQRWENLRREAGNLLLTLLLATVILILAAIFEVTESLLRAVGLVMWLPFILLLIVAILVRRRIIKSTDAVSP